MTKTFPMVITRDGADMVKVSLPMISAIGLVMIFGEGRHHPSICFLMGDLALNITDADILRWCEDDGAISKATVSRESLLEDDHSPSVSRFIVMGGMLTGRIHASELYGLAMTTSAIKRLDSEVLYQTIRTIQSASDKMVTDKERLTTYMIPAIMV